MNKVYARPDPLLNKEAYLDANARRIDAVVQSVDEVAVQMEKKWGTGKLERYAPPQLAEGFELARMAFDTALESGVVDDIRQKGENLIKGYRFLDANVTKLGHEPADPEVWHISGDTGQHYAICHDADAVDLVKPVEGVIVMTLRELLRFYESHEATKNWVNHAKSVFPGSTVSSVKIPEGELNDDLPF